MFVNEGRFRNRLAVTAVVIATIAMLTVPAIYAFWFHDWPIGEPRSWAEFGEFLAGTLGPIVSFATAVLLYLTLMDTRRMAMEEGVRRKREENIRLQTQRLEDTLTAWNLAIAVPFSGYVGLHRMVTDLPIKQLFGDRNFHAQIAQLAALNYRNDEPSRDALDVAFNDCINLLNEMAGYCETIDMLDPTRTVSNFYRNRVSTGVRYLTAAGLLGGNQEKIAGLNAPRYLGDVGAVAGLHATDIAGTRSR